MCLAGTASGERERESDRAISKRQMSIFMEIIVVKNYTHLFEANRVEAEHDRLIWKWTKCLISPPSTREGQCRNAKCQKRYSLTCFSFHLVSFPISLVGRNTSETAFIYSATSWPPSWSLSSWTGHVDRSLLFERLNKVINFRRLIVCSTPNNRIK